MSNRFAKLRSAQVRFDRADRNTTRLSCKKAPLTLEEEASLVLLRKYANKMLNAKIRFERRLCGAKSDLRPRLFRAHFKHATEFKRLKRAGGIEAATAYLLACGGSELPPV